MDAKTIRAEAEKIMEMGGPIYDTSIGVQAIESLVKKALEDDCFKHSERIEELEARIKRLEKGSFCTCFKVGSGEARGTVTGWSKLHSEGWDCKGLAINRSMDCVFGKCKSCRSPKND